MEPENQDAPEVLETPAEEQEPTQTPEEAPEPQTDEEKEELRRKVEDLEKKNKQLFERAKKNQAPSQDGLSNKDILYLAKADIHQDDLDDVVEMARLKKMSVADAHKFMEPILAQRAQERTSASLTHTRPSSRSAPQQSAEDVLLKAERGETIDSEEGLQQIFRARAARRTPHKK